MWRANLVTATLLTLAVSQARADDNRDGGDRIPDVDAHRTSGDRRSDATSDRVRDNGDPSTALRSRLADQLGEELATIERSLALVLEKLAELDAVRTRRLAAASRLLRTAGAHRRSAADPPSRAAHRTASARTPDAPDALPERPRGTGPHERGRADQPSTPGRSALAPTAVGPYAAPASYAVGPYAPGSSTSAPVGRDAPPGSSVRTLVGPYGPASTVTAGVGPYGPASTVTAGVGPYGSTASSLPASRP